MKKLLGLAVVAPVLAMAAPTDVRAGDRECGNGDILTGQIDDNVVATGGTCTLSGAIVDGNVKVEGGAEVLIVGGIVRGSVQGEFGSSVFVSGTNVFGDVQCEGAGAVPAGFFPGCRVQVATIGGSIQSNDAEATVSILSNPTIGGSIQVVGTTATAPVNINFNGSFSGDGVIGDVQVFENDGSVNVFFNVIDGNLQCKENEPTLINGSGNVVGGNKEDQCAGF